MEYLEGLRQGADFFLHREEDTQIAFADELLQRGLRQFSGAILEAILLGNEGRNYEIGQFITLTHDFVAFVVHGERLSESIELGTTVNYHRDREEKVMVLIDSRWLTD